jgi:NADH-quinone oxidoreductase subunit A
MTLIVLIVFILVVALLLFALSALLAPHRSDAEKLSAYETGLLAILGQTRAPFTIAFYLVAVLFAVFDLELVFMYPAAVSLESIGVYGYWILATFFLLLTGGFVLELGTGVLDLTSGVTRLNQPKSTDPS